MSGPYALESGADLDRLRRYRAERPSVLIGTGEFGTWQALITEASGETFVVRHTLHDLLDRLAEILGDR